MTKGDTYLQFNLGLMHQYNEGVSQNDKTAVKWDILAANQGVDLAQYNLGVMYYPGNGRVIQDNTMPICS